MGPSPSALELDLDVDAGGEVELHQRVHGLRRRVDDIEQALVGAHLELFAALLVDMRRPIDREFLDLGRQRNRAAHLSARTLGGRHDLARRRIEDAVIERLEPDPDILAVHLSCLSGLSSSAKADDPVTASASLHPRLRGIPGPPLSRGTTATLLDDARHHAGADSATALANGEAKLL